MLTKACVLALLGGAVAGLFGAGCSSPPPAPLAVGTPKAATNLSAEDVLGLADDFVTERNGDDPSFDLKRYPSRRAEYDPRARCWFVHYDRAPTRYPGDLFGVRVDDATGEVTLSAGK
jgi:hypothetical protein